VSFPVVHALEQLQQDGDEKAGQYLAAILRFEFIIALVAAEHILKSTVHLSTFLQGVKCDLVEAVKESDIQCTYIVFILQCQKSRKTCQI
jgi:hypothetical protein